jgi:uncharacterized membrane protein YfcA
VDVGLAGLLAIAAVAMAAASTQTMSGFGMNLILSPVAQVVLPGSGAVRLVVGLGAVLNACLLVTGRCSILWRPALLMTAPALIATVLLGRLISDIGTRIVGVIVAAATVLAAMAMVSRRVPRLTGTTGALTAGALSGALNVVSGVSGPPVAVYAATQPWTPQQLVATVQAIFLPINVAAFVVLNATPVPSNVTVVGVAGTGAGLLVGAHLRDQVPPMLIRSAVIAIALTGAIIVLVRSVT